MKTNFDSVIHWVIGSSMVTFFKEVYGRAKEAHVEHDGGFIVLGHALEHSVRGHGF